jgi:hypothetical protein
LIQIVLIKSILKEQFFSLVRICDLKQSKVDF